MNLEIAQNFTDKWIKSWNNQDLEEIISHYADNIQFYSPLIPLLGFNDSGIIQNKEDLKKYFEIGLRNYPNLFFDLHHVFVGINTLVIYYTSVNGRKASEVFELDENEKALKVFCNYN